MLSFQHSLELDFFNNPIGIRNQNSSTKTLSLIKAVVEWQDFWHIHQAPHCRPGFNRHIYSSHLSVSSSHCRPVKILTQKIIHSDVIKKKNDRANSPILTYFCLILCNNLLLKYSLFWGRPWLQFKNIIISLKTDIKKDMKWILSCTTCCQMR